jgi:hypothetical protein
MGTRQNFLAGFIAPSTITGFTAFLRASFMLAAPLTQFLQIIRKMIQNSNTQTEIQFTLQGIQGSQHLCRHLLCEQEYSHFCEHGGQARPQLTLQMCPQTRERPHFSAHARWTRPLKHSPQAPLQGCSQSSMALHGFMQVVRWD